MSAKDRTAARGARTWATALAPDQRQALLAECKAELSTLGRAARAGDKRAKSRSRWLQRRIDALRKVTRLTGRRDRGHDGAAVPLPPVPPPGPATD